MTGTLEITNGEGLRVDFMSGDLYLQARGNAPAVAEEIYPGYYADIEDLYTLRWRETNDNQRAETLRTLHLLAEQARAYYREGRTWDPVWIMARGYTEGEPRYALVKDVRIADLDPRYWGPPVNTALTVTIVREGAWRGIRPDKDGIRVINSKTIYNKADEDGNNYAILPAEEIGGDLPALLKITFSKTRSMLVARRSVPPEDGTFLVSNHIHPITVDTADQAGLVTDTDAPADKRYQVTTGLDTFGWTESGITSFTYKYWRGQYAYYAVMGAGGAGQTAQLIIDAYAGGPIVNLEDSGNKKSYYMGRHSIPPTGYNRLDRAVYQQIEWNGASGAEPGYLWTLLRVPLEDGDPFTVEAPFTSTNSMVIDGIVERVATDAYTALRPGGLYPTAKAGQDTILLFYWYDQNGEVDFNDSMSVDVDVVPRYAALRGVR